MKIYGQIRGIDDFGRVAIPKDIRESLEIKVGCLLEIVVIDGLIIIGKVKESDNNAE